MELQCAVDQINEELVESAKASLATRWNDAVKGIDTTAGLCAAAIAKYIATSTTRINETGETAHQQLDTAVTSHVATLKTSADAL